MIYLDYGSRTGTLDIWSNSSYTIDICNFGGK
jgi:hypothetical protein